MLVALRTELTRDFFIMHEIILFHPGDYGGNDVKTMQKIGFKSDSKKSQTE